MNVSNNQIYFVIGSAVFVAVGVVFDVLLLVGGGCGFLGCWFVKPVYENWQYHRRLKRYEKDKERLKKLEVEIQDEQRRRKEV